jgi:tetratricopeptide (TPR) repeat protein
LPRRDQVAAAAVAATLLVSAMAIGGATRWTAVAAAAMGLGCGALHLVARRELRRIPWLLWLLGAAVAATALQLVPLPVALLPARGALEAANAAALGAAAPRWIPITYDPAASWLELAKLVGYLGFASCVIRLAASRRSRAAVAAAVAATGAVVAATAVLHYLAGAEELFGLYAPRHMKPPALLAPLLNPNSLAGLLATSCPVAVAMAMTRDGSRRLLWAAAAGLTAAVGLLAGSRMGVLSLVFGLGAFAALAAPQLPAPRRPRLDPASRAAIGLIVAIVAVAGLYVFGGAAIEELLGTGGDELVGERGKVHAWRVALSLLAEHPFTGVGRGGFEPAFYGAVEGERIHSHVENEYMQAVLDWGIPVALGLLALAVLTARGAAARARGSLVEAGLAAAAIAAALHAVADFALELPGAAYPALAAVAVLGRGELVVRRSRIGLRAAALVAGAAVIAVAASPVATPARAETDVLAGWDGPPAAAPETAIDRAIATWRRHPRDFIAAAQCAEALFAARDPRAVAVMNRALAMSPSHPGLHHLAARMLRVSQRPEQALVEYRLALTHGGAPGPILAEVLVAFPEPERAVRALPIERMAAWRVLPALRGRRDPALGLRYTTDLVRRYPAIGRFHRERAHYALALGDLDEAARAGQAAVAAGDDAAIAVAAEALLRGERHAEAEAVLSAAAERPRPPSQILRELHLLARARHGQGKGAEALEALEAAVEIAGSDRPEAARYFDYMAKIQEEMGLDAAAQQTRARARRARAGGARQAP